MADSIDLIRRLEIANSQLIGSADNHKAITDAIRALSPAGGDWVAKEGDRALGKNRGYALAAPPQQEPGAELTESEQASIDAAIYGTGVMVDGKRVAPEHVYIATPASFTEKELDKFVNALTATSAGTTGDDSEDAALPYLSEQMQGFLRVHPFGYSHALGLLNEYARAARRAREVGK